MARITLSRNLKLKISSDLTADARYNLERIDTLAGAMLPTLTGDTSVRSAGDITLEPNSPDLGGTGSGGTISLGSVDQPLTSLAINAATVSFSSSLSLSDQATGGTKTLNLKYKSDLSGAVDTAADRALSFDLNGADRDVILGTNLTLLGPGSLSLTVPASLSLTLPSSVGSNGQVLTTNGSGTLSWESATAASLDGLTDVSLTSPAEGDLLVFDADTSLWKNSKPYLAASWAPGDGATKVITHNLNTFNTLVQILDENKKQIEVADIDATSLTDITLTASQAPGGTWTVLIYSLI